MKCVAGISGGRSSGLVAKKYAPADAVLVFCNTGFEHPATIDFLAHIEQDIGRRIYAIEYRAPPSGQPPAQSTFEIVDGWHRLSMDGEPFLAYLECARTYRADLDPPKPPIAPSTIRGGRYCTAHLKLKTKERFVASLGMGTPRDYTDLCGLRADEPERVARMKLRNDARDTDERAPLFDAGVTKADVLSFWAKQKYDLAIPDYLGNCVGCFMKDERDLASALTLDPIGRAHAGTLIEIERRYAPMRRGGRPSYAQVVDEAPDRMKIRDALARGQSTDPLFLSTTLPARRQELIARQEKRAASSWSCSCDDAHDIAAAIANRESINVVDETKGQAP